MQIYMINTPLYFNVSFALYVLCDYGIIRVFSEEYVNVLFNKFYFIKCVGKILVTVSCSQI